MMDAEPGRGVGMRSLDGRFWQFAGAYATTALADGVRFAALPLLAASLTHRPLLVALVGVGESLPWLVVGLPSGVLVDRHDRKRVVQVAAVVREVVMLVLIAALLLHRDTVALLIGLAFLLGSADTFSANAQVGL
ncbi:MAG: MFS transporter, partial [Candidatus Dormibacteria bacterium]